MKIWRVLLIPFLLPGAAVYSADPVAVEGCANAHWLTSKVLVGGQPDGLTGFRSLLKQQIATVISVDGVEPDVASARRCGLRYVHVPISYREVTDGQVNTIAAAIHQLPGPVYIHCHHGKHRAPAAAAATCIAMREISAETALQFLRTAGTDFRYDGLVKSVRTSRPIPPGHLNAIRQFTDCVSPPRLVDTMGQLDRTLKHLEHDVQMHDGKAAIRNSLALHELLRELCRQPALKNEAKQFRILLTRAEQSAASLNRHLNNTNPCDTVKTRELLRQVKSSCLNCHSRLPAK